MTTTRPYDSVECECGARTGLANLAKEGHEPIIFVGGSHKHGRMKYSIERTNEATVRCLWCGTKWTGALKKVMSMAVNRESK